MTTPISTIIRDIAATTNNDQWPLNWRLKQQAVEAFGALNGWRKARNSHEIEDIGKRCAKTKNFAARSELSEKIFDHCVWYRGNGKCAAIVAQPYGHVKDDDAKALAAEHGVAVHTPPHPLASFHFPAETKFFVFTLPDHEMVWLPEQITGIREADMQAAE